MTVSCEDNRDRDTVEMVEVTVDGRAIRLLKGQNLLEALVDSGEQISYFCYHSGLSVAAQCRQCLVGLGNPPRLVPACQLKVEPGMTIESKSDHVLEARRAMLEFTLLNHPVDCVICDKAGECALQRHYMDWDGKPAQVNHAKVHKPKHVDLGPEIVLDAERCILCSRCIRFCSEVARQPQLVFIQRGDHTVLTTAPGERLDNAYSLNTVDICPVGALTDKDFRFKSRVWDLWATPSTCNGCAAGCSMEIHHKNGQIYRLVPAKRWDMNSNWMCDFGRRTYYEIRENRLAQPLIDGASAEPNQAIQRIAEQLRPLIEAGPESALAVVLGADITNEDCFAAVSLAREIGGTSLYLGDRPDNGLGDDILRRNDPNPNRAGVRYLAAGLPLQDRDRLAADLLRGRIRALYVVGDALELSADLLDQLGSLPLVIIQATRTSRLTQRAHVVLPAASWAEVDGTITNDQEETKRLHRAVEPPGYARPHWALVQAVSRSLGSAPPYESAHELFEAMAQRFPLFANVSWGDEAVATRRLRWSGRRG